MANFHQPSIGEVVMPHFLLFEPRRRLCRIGYGNELVIIRMVDIVDPGIGLCYLMKWKIGALR